MGRQVGLQQAVREGKLDLHYWAEHTLEQIRARMRTQNVWPYGMPGPYREYAYINAKKAGKHNAWFSTGAAAKEMYALVWNAASGDTMKVSFFFQHYLNMVDMGVGSGRKLGQVTERSTPNHAYQMLFARWGGINFGSGKNQGRRRDDEQSPRRARPFLMQELRHQGIRLEAIVNRYVSTFMEINTMTNYNHSFKDQKYHFLEGVNVVVHPETKVEEIH